MEIIDRLQPIEKLYTEDRLEECIIELQRLWEECPKPREKDGNTFLILSDITKILCKLDRFEDAIEWSLRSIRYNGTRSLAGEGEMMIGECAFAAGRIELAKDMFQTARFKGGKRIFQGQPKEFWELAKEK